MDQIELSSQALSILTTKGWDGSLRNIDRDLMDLNEGGFNLPPTEYAISLLKKYSGLEFETISEYTQSR
jgi:hypothetical protein